MFIRVDGTAIAIPVTQNAPLNLASVGKYTSQLFVPPAMPPTATTAVLDQYNISARQISQQILPSGMPATKVWGYGSNPAMTHSSPSFTIEARANRAAQVTWINGLKDASGRFLPHLLAVDPTLHWANPPGGVSGRDSMPDFTGMPTPGPYTGPVPLSTHLHGAHVGDESDGFPEAWYLPTATNIPPGTPRRARTGAASPRSSRACSAPPGSLAPRCPATPTTRRRPRCGSTTTRWG